MFKNHSTIIKKVFSRAYYYTALLFSFFCCLVFTIVISSPLEAKYGIKKFLDSHIIRKGILHFRVPFCNSWVKNFMNVYNSKLKIVTYCETLRLIEFKNFYKMKENIAFLKKNISWYLCIGTL